MTDDLFDPLTPPTPSTSTKRCRRHDWAEDVTHTALEPRYRCTRCAAPRNEAVVKRNRNNRQRGGAFERTVAKQLGGRRTGPLGGRDDVVIGDLFTAQTKRAARFSLTEARAYLADLRRTYPTRVPLVVHALPGERGGVVILDLSSWIELHGKDVVDE